MRPFSWWIDFGYAVKLGPSTLVDLSCGLSPTDKDSLVEFLNACYKVRRPGFVMTDIVFVELPSALLEVWVQYWMQYVRGAR